MSRHDRTGMPKSRGNPCKETLKQFKLAHIHHQSVHKDQRLVVFHTSKWIFDPVYFKYSTINRNTRNKILNKIWVSNPITSTSLIIFNALSETRKIIVPNEILWRITKIQNIFSFPICDNLPFVWGFFCYLFFSLNSL